MKTKVAIITGSSRGIGKALARRFLEAGYRVVINARHGGQLFRAEFDLAARGEVLAVKADVSRFEDCQRLVAATMSRFGRIDVLINNAGLSMEGELDGLNPSVFSQVVHANLTGAANITIAALPEIKRCSGQILFVSSQAGLLGLPGFSAYSASKMGLTALAQSLRGELYGTDVNIGLAYLGFTENDAHKEILNRAGEMVAQPDRNFVNAAPVNWVAKQLLRMVERRKQQAYIGPPGRIAAWANWIVPGLCQWYAGYIYRKHITCEPAAIGQDPLTVDLTNPSRTVDGA